MTRPLLLAAIAAACACGRAIDLLDLERMQNQAKVEPYEASSIFADGRGMRVPPVGTVARERELGPPELVSGATPDGEVTSVPIEVDRELLERGRDRFERICGACHGVLGTGNPAIVENSELRPPPSLHEPRIRAQPPGRLFGTVSLGFGLMPPYRAELSVADRWAVVAYLPVLWASQSAELEALPADIQAEAHAALAEASASP